MCCGAGQRLLCKLENAAGCKEEKNSLRVCRRTAAYQCAKKEHHPPQRAAGMGPSSDWRLHVHISLDSLWVVLEE